MRDKLIYIANIRLPTEKAHGIQIMKMCEAFARQGQDVTLVVPQRYNTINTDPFTYYQVESIFKIKYLPTLDLIFAGRIGFWVQQTLFAVYSAFFTLKIKNKLVYSRDELPLWFLSLIAPSSPFIWEAHINRINFLINRVIKRSVMVVTITAALTHFFKIYQSQARYHVAPDGIDLKLFLDLPDDKSQLRQELDLPTDKKIVAYIGKYKTMSQDKGVASLIGIFPQVLTRCPEALLLLVGIDARELSNVEALLAKYNISSASRVVLHVPHSQAMRFLTASDLVVMNYPATGHFTSFMSPLKLFEYMASGRPIVTSDLPSIREILDDQTALFFPPGDLDAFVRSITKVLGNYQQYQAMAVRARLLVENYTWDKRAEKIIHELS